MHGLSIASSIAFFAMSVPVLAHHGTGTYDSSKSVTLSGIVTEFAISNPHAAMLAIRSRSPFVQQRLALLWGC